MKKYYINSKGEADHLSTSYYLADEADFMRIANHQNRVN